MKNIVIIIILIFVGGCATSPVLYVDAPWKRIVNPGEVSLSDSYSLEISGSDVVFPKGSHYTSEKINQIINDYLIRRGMKIINSEKGPSIKVYYNTEKHFVDNIDISAIQDVSFPNFGDNDLYSSLIGIYTDKVNVKNSVNIKNTFREVFIHALEIEIVDKDDNLKWRGETRWYDDNFDISESLTKVVKYLVSELPRVDEPQVKLKKIKKESFSIYFDINLRAENFVCPALPYYIRFDAYPNRLPKGIKNPEYMSGYRDMLLYAEKAIPVGDAYDDLMSEKLWKKAWIASEYTISGEKIMLLIKLVGNPDGYKISECKEATELEKEYYTLKSNEYENAVKSYFNYYE